jgi:hypothetical protein
MRPKSKLRHHLLLCASAILAGSPAHAATMSSSPAAPVIDGQDIANHSNVTASIILVPRHAYVPKKVVPLLKCFRQ